MELNNTQSRLLNTPQLGGKIMGYKDLKTGREWVEIPLSYHQGEVKGRWFGYNLDQG